MSGRGSTEGNCVTCGRGFVGMRNRRYCSDPCKKLAWTQRRMFTRPQGAKKLRGTTPGNCLTCGTPFIGLKNRRYCSSRCAERARRPLRRDYDRERARRYRGRFPDRVRAYRTAHKEERAESSRRWRQTHRERSREIQRHYRDRNREHYRQLLRNWDKRNREKRRATSAAWRKAHPDRHAHISARRRALELAAPGSHTYEEWQALLSEWDHRCAYCGAAGVPLQRDHVVALALGGSHDIANILPACRTCNARKRLMAREEFEQLLLEESRGVIGS